MRLSRRTRRWLGPEHELRRPVELLQRVPEALEPLAAPFQPSVAATAHAVEVVPAHELAVAVEVHANLVARATPRTAALVGERRERRGIYHGGGL